MIDVNYKWCEGFIDESTIEKFLKKAELAIDKLEQEKLKAEKSNEENYLGWIDLPSKMLNSNILDQCNEIVERWSTGIDIVVVIGIGGSYLGSKSMIDALSHSFGSQMEGSKPKIVYAGHNMSEDYLSELCDYMDGRSVACLVVSKSGTTTEPAISFRLIKKYIDEKYGKEDAKNRIVAITDSSKGVLKELADKEGYKTFVIPDDVGGRYSIFTPVGLLPIALAGHDVKSMLEGALEMKRICSEKNTSNPAIKYVAIRNALYEMGKKIEVLAYYNPKLVLLGEWWKQLYGESEGKEGKGLFPAAVSYTADLHSMGQYLQDGPRILFETVLSIEHSNREIVIEENAENLDGLNFLSKKTVGECNKKAEIATMLAHYDGGVPSILLKIDSVNEYNMGALYYFFEFSCALSGYVLGVNPFDQPGVELYKKNMFALLNKPGYEKETEIIKTRLNSETL